MSRFFKQHLQLTVAVPPRSLSAVGALVASKLDGQLLRPFGGAGMVLVAYEDLKVDPLAEVSYYQPEVLVGASVECYFYAPGEKVIAEVMAVTNGTFAQLQICGVFGGQIKAPWEVEVGQLLRVKTNGVYGDRDGAKVRCDVGEGCGVIVGANDDPVNADGRVLQ